MTALNTTDLLLLAAAAAGELTYQPHGAAIFSWRSCPVDDDTRHRLVALLRNDWLAGGSYLEPWTVRLGEKGELLAALDSISS
jgi:hypothetical protein